MQRNVFLLSVALLALSGRCSRVSAQQAGPVTHIVLDSKEVGPVFDGIGAVSAGASSRLLYDYPEPSRSQVLDYLFKPNYGAALQHLKVEIGADANSTDGSEPSHMRSRTDHDYTRGYEWWLMNEARKRNPKIVLDILPWGAPAWVGNGHLYSEDMAYYVADFIQGAHKTYGLDIAYTGIWNETTFDPTYVKTLRRVLDADHLSTKIVCCDEYPKKDVDQWGIVDAMKHDPELARAVDVISVHYPRENGKLTTPESARSQKRPLWSSEDQPASSASDILSRDWAIGGRLLAQLYNENFLKGGFTATEIWSPVTSYYDLLAAPNSGLMYANTPWSGNYRVQGAIWATAHTTQFTQVGWRYLKSASGTLPEKGDYVSLRSPDGKEWTVVLQTIDAKLPQTVQFAVRNSLRSGKAYVWETNRDKSFEKVSEVRLNNGTFSFRFDPDSLYTVTSTTGQGRGTQQPPSPDPFPFPYRDGFEQVPLHRAPRFLSDQNGAFEVTACKNRTGMCLEQVITQKPIPWGPLPQPWTLAGDAAWKDYAVDLDFNQLEQGEVTLIGRVDSADVFKDAKAEFPSGYVLRVGSDGAWRLLSCAYKKPDKVLAEGKWNASGKVWHHARLVFVGDRISATVDGTMLGMVNNGEHTKGMFGLGTGWHRAQFDQLAVTQP